MTSALIGHTGFVGTNLRLRHEFDGLYNSTNLGDITGREYDVVVSAAGRADSYRINKQPDADMAELEHIARTLGTVRARRVVLISTVCVYAGGTSPDEDAELPPDELTPYGRNRLRLEQLVSERFDTLIVRLPQLYGAGMKKGLVFDLANRHRVEHIRPDGVFQYYDLSRLWADITVALDAGIASLNMAIPPITHERLAREVFGIDIRGQVPPEPESPFVRMYSRDMRTTHAALFGADGPYLLTEEQELAAVRRFVDSVTRSA